MLIRTSNSHLSLLPVIGKVVPLVEGNQLRVPEECLLLSNHQKLGNEISFGFARHQMFKLMADKEGFHIARIT